MWIVELAFTGTPERLAARPAHRDRLTALHRAGTVRMAGPLDDDSGAVILVDLDDRADVDALIADDPYYRTAGVTIVGIRCWRPFLG
ncbi:hypothetical protein GCM10009557_33820 [Virgisporangium ochraceum]|uniref:YCII-related domain-containing protein n=1 Tax=Virgisporangium ochraceum TaxID=65505 RepID=A0A8J4ECG4_9ACTN|nr:YciI family protein [Virgisporangium ochraceum]GIJ69671.1 hypothetical protein Voc01_045880 [Virgisporangium ochraceum]